MVSLVYKRSLTNISSFSQILISSCFMLLHILNAFSIIYFYLTFLLSLKNKNGKLNMNRKKPDNTAKNTCSNFELFLSFLSTVFLNCYCCVVGLDLISCVGGLDLVSCGDTFLLRLSIVGFKN